MNVEGKVDRRVTVDTIDITGSNNFVCPTPGQPTRQPNVEGMETFPQPHRWQQVHHRIPRLSHSLRFFRAIPKEIFGRVTQTLTKHTFPATPL
jgi:hypothetical protein